MEEKASNLDEENKMLRQVVASIPTIKSPLTENRETPNIQVPAMSIAKLLRARLPSPIYYMLDYHRQSNDSCAYVCWQESPDNEKTPNGAVKPIIVDREGTIHVCMSLQPPRPINTYF